MTTNPLGISSGIIFQQIPKIMADVGAISKEQKNTAQGYRFRGVDDIYNALHSVLAVHGVFTTSEIVWERTEDRTTAKGSPLVYRVMLIRWRFWASDGSHVVSETIGEGCDQSDKASNKAMSVAHKYAFLQALAIPTQEAKDPEIDSHELASPVYDDIPFAGQPVKMIPPTAEKYDPKNEKHQARLTAQLEERQIPFKKWDDIGFELAGKPMTAETLAAAVRKVMK